MVERQGNDLERALSAHYLSPTRQCNPFGPDIEIFEMQGLGPTTAFRKNLKRVIASRMYCWKYPFDQKSLRRFQIFVAGACAMLYRLMSVRWSDVTN